MTNRINSPRILFVHPSAAGGAAVSLSLLLKAVRRAGFVTGLVTFTKGERFEDLLAPHCDFYTTIQAGPFEHTTWSWGNLANPFLAQRFARAVRQWPNAKKQLLDAAKTFRPDALYCNTASAIPYGLVAREVGCKAVLHVREPVAQGYLGLRRDALRRIANQAFDHVFYITRHERNTFPLDVPSSIVRNWIDWNGQELDLDPEDPNGTHGGDQKGSQSSAHGPGVPNILFVGGLSRVKGLRILLSALLQLTDKGTNFRLTVLAVRPPGPGHRRTKDTLRLLLKTAGQPITLDMLETLARRLPPDRVQIHPFVEDTRPHFADADIVAFPALQDHFSRPLVEAAAMAKPSVASDFDGPREVIVPEVTGLLVPPADPVSLAQALERLISDQDLRRTMGRRARAVYERLFSPKNADRIVQTLEELVHT